LHPQALLSIGGASLEYMELTLPGPGRLVHLPATFHKTFPRTMVCKRKIEMSPGVQSRNDTPSGAARPLNLMRRG
jgi:hypothetical protein